MSALRVSAHQQKALLSPRGELDSYSSQLQEQQRIEMDAELSGELAGNPAKHLQAVMLLLQRVQ